MALRHRGCFVAASATLQRILCHGTCLRAVCYSLDCRLSTKVARTYLQAIAFASAHAVRRIGSSPTVFFTFFVYVPAR
eukprot:4319529-Pleurochrysis_carterae.AAC.1